MKMKVEVRNLIDSIVGLIENKFNYETIYKLAANEETPGNMLERILEVCKKEFTFMVSYSATENGNIVKNVCGRRVDKELVDDYFKLLYRLAENKRISLDALIRIEAIATDVNFTTLIDDTDVDMRHIRCWLSLVNEAAEKNINSRAYHPVLAIYEEKYEELTSVVCEETSIAV